MARKKVKQYVYMVVSADKYELPLGVYDSPIEMARETGKNYSSILSALCRKHEKSIYRKVRVDKEDEQT